MVINIVRLTERNGGSVGVGLSGGGVDSVFNADLVASLEGARGGVTGVVEESVEHGGLDAVNAGDGDNVGGCVGVCDDE